MAANGPLQIKIEGGRFSEVRAADSGLEPSVWIMPGFIDAHCHILPTGLDLLKLHLGSAQSPSEVLSSIADWNRDTDQGTWLHAVHYDQTKFEGAVHLNRHDLDKVSTDRPILLRHVNGHASIANSAALRAAGVDESTQNPRGGTFERDQAGRLTGVLLERAHEVVSAASPAPSIDQMVEAILHASAEMSGFGITTATDMMTGHRGLEQELTAYRIAAERGCPVRLRLCLQWATVLGPRALDPLRLSELIESLPEDFCKVIGVKIFADGAIGSATAAIHSVYNTTGGQGSLIYEPTKLSSMVARAHDEGWQVAIHSIGDRSTDHVMDAFEATGEPSRHRLEHAMILSDAQIDRIAKSGCHVTMQPEFLTRFGHAYRAQLDSTVFPQLKRVRSCLQAGIPMSFNSDRPIVLGDPWVGIQTAVDRPVGFDSSENIPMSQAVDLYTAGGAVANGDQQNGGRIESGLFADYHLYAAEPAPGVNRLTTVMGGIDR